MRVNFLTDPSQYRHWKLNISGECAELILDVDENGGLYEGYELKLNSYDLGVDIELNDAIQRLRFENPKVKAAVLADVENQVTDDTVIASNTSTIPLKVLSEKMSEKMKKGLFMANSRMPWMIKLS